MDQGELGRGTGRHEKATPHSSPCQKEQQLTVGGVGFVHVRMIYLVRTQLAYSSEKTKSCFLSDFYFIIVYLSGPGVSEIRTYDILFFRGSIWMRLKNSGSFCVGQVPRTSHVATRPKNRVRDASVPRCRGLLQQAPPPVCSCCRRCRADTRICSWTTLYSFFPCVLLFFFSAGTNKNTRGNSLLLLDPAVRAVSCLTISCQLVIGWLGI